MQLLNALSLTVLAFAASSQSAELPTCISQPWEVRSLTIFQAASSSDVGSYISFYFSDPNFNISQVACGTSLAYGHDSYTNSLEALGWVSCDVGEFGIAFQVTSYDLELRRATVDCGK